MINLALRISRLTLENPGSGGQVDVSRYLDEGGFSTRRSQLKRAIVRNGEINFVTPEYDASPIDLDKRTNSLWCRGTICRIFATDTRGDEYQLAELVLQKTTVRRFDRDRTVRAIGCSFTDYLGERNEKGKDIETIGESGATRRSLVEAALREGSTRTLDIQLNHIPEDPLVGIFPLLANRSPADLAAELAAASLCWLYVDNEGTIRDIPTKLSNEGSQAPVVRMATLDCARFDFIPPSEDIVGAVAVSTNLSVPKSNPLPYVSIEESYARLSDLFDNPDIGSQVVLATRVLTRVNTRGEVTREVMKPLASWITFSDTSDFDPSYLGWLTQYLTVIYEDGLRQHNFDFQLIAQSGTTVGPIGCFRRNYSSSVKDTFENPAAVIQNVTLRRQKVIVHADGLPLQSRGFEEDLADNYRNTGVTHDDFSTRTTQIKWNEQWIEWGRGQYRRKFHNSAPNLRSEATFGPVTGPPSPDYLQEADPFDTELLEDVYETDVSGVNCGQDKQIPIQIPYGKEDLLARVGQWELERRIAADRAIRAAIALPNIFLKNYKPFERLDIGKYSYKMEAPSVAWGGDRTLVLAFEGHETGTLTNEIEYAGSESSGWPRSADRTFTPIANSATCGVPILGPNLPTTPSLFPIPDITCYEGQEIDSVQLQTVGGAGPYAYSVVSGTLPGNIVLNGSRIEGSGGAPAGPTTIRIRVTDSLSQTSEEEFAVQILAIPAVSFPVPATLPIKSGLALGGFMRLLEYPLTQPSLAFQGGLAAGGQMELLPQTILVPALPSEGAIALSGQMTLDAQVAGPTITGGLALSGQMILGAATDPTAASGAIALSGRMALGAASAIPAEGAIALSGQMELGVQLAPLVVEGGIALSGSMEVSLNSFEFNDESNFEFNDGSNFEFNE